MYCEPNTVLSASVKPQSTLPPTLWVVCELCALLGIVPCATGARVLGWARHGTSQNGAGFAVDANVLTADHRRDVGRGHHAAAAQDRAVETERVVFVPWMGECEQNAATQSGVVPPTTTEANPSIVVASKA